VSSTSSADTSKAGSSPAIGLAGTATPNISESANGRGAIASSTGNIAGSGGAVVYVDDPAEILLIGTDSSLLDPQIITMAQ
jgi:hypothetical protein